MRTSILTAVVFLALLSGCRQHGAPAEYSRVGTVMDTFVQVKVSDAALGRDRLESAVEGCLGLAEELSGKFSAFSPSSEINLLNTRKRMEVSPDLLDVISRSADMSSLTGGGFDVTVAPILKRQGLYRNMPEVILREIPDDTAAVNWRNVGINEEDGIITLKGGAWVDLSGIAKGYIVDRMSAFLSEAGIASVMVNAGGDIYCGARIGGGEWLVGVRKPGKGAVSLVLGLKNTAVATSGDYENFVRDEATGEEVSHIADPDSGRTLKKSISSVTVIAPDCAQADALATGMMAMGPEKGIALADSTPGVEVIYIFEEAGKERVVMSKGAGEYIVD